MRNDIYKNITDEHQFLLQSINQIITINDNQEAITILLNNVKLFLSADSTYIITSDNRLFSWNGNNTMPIPFLDYKMFAEMKNHDAKILTNIEDLKEQYYSLYSFFKQRNVHKLSTIKLTQPWGYLLIENPKKNVNPNFILEVTKLVVTIFDKLAINNAGFTKGDQRLAIARAMKYYRTMKIGFSKSIYDDENTIIWANDSFFSIFGISKEDFSSKMSGKFARLINIIDYDEEIDFHEDLKKDGMSSRLLHYTKEDDSIHWIYIQNFLTGEKINNIPVIYSSYIDATELYNVFNGFHIKENFIKTLNESVLSSLFQLNTNLDELKIVHNNSNFLQLLKVNKNELSEQYHDLFLPFIRLPFQSPFLELLSNLKLNEETQLFQYEIINSKGEVRYLNSQIARIINQNGQEVYQIVSYDMTSIRETTVEKMAAYQNIPGFVAKFIITDKIQLLDANNRFFDFFDTTIDDFNKSEDIPVFIDDIKTIKALIPRMHLKEPVETEFRIIKNNQEEWFHVEASCINTYEENPIYLGVFIDVTKFKKLQYELEQEKERYRLVLKISTDVIFEYDIQNDLYKEYGAFQNDINKSDHEIDHYLENLKKKYPNRYDLQNWILLLSGVEVEAFECNRIVNNNDNFQRIWGKVEGTILYMDNKPIKVIGKITDITEAKEKELKQIEASNLDKLTNFYTRSRGEYLIKKNLLDKPENEICTILLIDIDNCKLINKTYGYMFGNVVIYELSQIIRDCINSDYLACRLGSDDFVILLKNSNIQIAKNIGTDICSKCKKIYLGEDHEITFSCSVAVVSSMIAKDYDSMMKTADIIISNIKNVGGGFCASYLDINNNVALIYEKHSFDDDYPMVSLYSQKDEDLISFALEILEKANDISNSILILLSRIGKKYGLKRIGIYEIDPKYLIVNNTYEWCESYQSQKGNVNHLSQEEYHTLKSKYDNGIYELTVIENDTFLEKMGKVFKLVSGQSALNCAIYDFSNFIGSINYQHQDKNYQWNPEDRLIIYELSKILSTYIKKANAENERQLKSDFLSKMSHEIRTPLNSIIGMTQIAQEQNNVNPKITEYLKKIDISARYLLTLINNTLDIAKIENGKMKLCIDSFDINDLIDEIEFLMRVQADQKKINFKIIKRIHNNKLIGDSLRLNQVLVNIIGNAIKFTNENGYVMVLVEELTTEMNNVSFKFTVKDNGIGIKKENLKRIFMSFEQEDNSSANRFGGSGLGLTISSNIVKLMGGALEVISEEKKGSEFFFTLSFKKDSTQNMPMNISFDCDEVRIKHNFGGKHLLLVEDNDLNAEIIQTILQDTNISIDLAHDGQDALDKYHEKEVYYYDVILMDIRMPIMDGLKATQLIRRSNKDDALLIPIIAMTANAYDDEIKEALNCGMNSYISKPIDINILCNELSEIFFASELYYRCQI